MLGVLLGSACAPAATEPPPQAPLSLALGTVSVQQTGDNRWVDFENGGPAELVPGAQGGFHVWLLYRISGNNVPQQVQVQRKADRIAPDGTRQRVLTVSTQLELPAQPLWESPTPLPSFMCPTPLGVNILDAPVELEVRISEAKPDGMLLCEARVLFQPVCPPPTDPLHDFCLGICQG